MTTFPFPARRRCLIETQRFPALHAAWQRTAATLQVADALLREAAMDGLVSVAVSGSLGRMEQLPHSDGDLIVILDDAHAAEPGRAAQLVRSVWQALEPLGIFRPNPGGIYAVPGFPRQLLEPATRGQIDEPVNTFGQRIQLLLDAQPVFGIDEFVRLQSQIVERYLGEPPELRYLLDDLIRYYRSLHVYYRWDARDRPWKWRSRNIKLRHNRLLNFAGLLFSLGEVGRDRGEANAVLAAALRLTPLERIARSYTRAGDEGIALVCEYYDRFLSRMENEVVRTALFNPAERDAVAGFTSERVRLAEFDDLLKNAAALSAELFRFVRSRRGIWNEEFLESLLF